MFLYFIAFHQRDLLERLFFALWLIILGWKRGIKTYCLFGFLLLLVWKLAVWLGSYQLLVIHRFTDVCHMKTYVSYFSELSCRGPWGDA